MTYPRPDLSPLSIVFPGQPLEPLGGDVQAAATATSAETTSGATSAEAE